MQEARVWSLGQKDPLLKKMAAHSSILDWITPWTEEPDGPQFVGSQESDTTSPPLTQECLLNMKVKVKVAQWCPTLCNPMDFRVYGILQARTLECVAFPFSRASSQPRDQTQVSRIVGGFFTNWAIGEDLLNMICLNYHPLWAQRKEPQPGSAFSLCDLEHVYSLSEPWFFLCKWMNCRALGGQSQKAAELGWAGQRA